MIYSTETYSVILVKSNVYELGGYQVSKMMNTHHDDSVSKDGI